MRRTVVRAVSGTGRFLQQEYSMRHTSIAVLSAALLIATACSSKSPLTYQNGNPTTTTNNGTVTVSVDGASWTATSIAVVKGTGFITVGATYISPTFSTQSIGFTVLTTTGLSPQNVSAGGTTADLIIGSSSWAASASMGSGSVLPVTITATHAVGNFTFVMQASASGTTPQSRTVTGTFDVTF
jgi:hypothetical protein